MRYLTAISYAISHEISHYAIPHAISYGYRMRYRMRYRIVRYLEDIFLSHKISHAISHCDIAMRYFWDYIACDISCDIACNAISHAIKKLSHLSRIQMVSSNIVYIYIEVLLEYCVVLWAIMILFSCQWVSLQPAQWLGGTRIVTESAGHHGWTNHWQFMLLLKFQVAYY